MSVLVIRDAQAHQTGPFGPEVQKDLSEHKAWEKGERAPACCAGKEAIERDSPSPDGHLAVGRREEGLDEVLPGGPGGVSPGVLLERRAEGFQEGPFGPPPAGDCRADELQEVKAVLSQGPSTGPQEIHQRPSCGPGNRLHQDSLLRETDEEEARAHTAKGRERHRQSSRLCDDIRDSPRVQIHLGGRPGAERNSPRKDSACLDKGGQVVWDSHPLPPAGPGVLHGRGTAGASTPALRILHGRQAAREHTRDKGAGNEVQEVGHEDFPHMDGFVWEDRYRRSIHRAPEYEAGHRKDEDAVLYLCRLAHQDAPQEDEGVLREKVQDRILLPDVQPRLGPDELEEPDDSLSLCRRSFRRAEPMDPDEIRGMCQAPEGSENDRRGPATVEVLRRYPLQGARSSLGRREGYHRRWQPTERVLEEPGLPSEMRDEICHATAKYWIEFRAIAEVYIYDGPETPTSKTMASAS